MTPTQGTTLDAWAREMTAQGYSQATVKAMTSAVRGCATFAGVAPADLTRDDVLTWLGARERARWTRVKYLDWLKAWGAFCGRPDLLDGVRRPRAPIGVPRPVAEGDLSAVLSVCRGRERAWVLLGAFCGLRAHESAKVAVEDLEQVAGGDWILRVLGKGGQLAVVPCPPVVVRELRAAAAGARSGRLWPDATTRTVQGAVTRAARRAGVRCTSHQLRHRYGTVMYATSKDLLLTQQVMRHQSPATTAGYALVSADRAQLVAAALPGAGEEPAGRPRLRLVT